jgi:hypothetical protein
MPKGMTQRFALYRWLSFAALELPNPRSVQVASCPIPDRDPVSAGRYSRPIATGTDADTRQRPGPSAVAIRAANFLMPVAMVGVREDRHPAAHVRRCRINGRCGQLPWRRDITWPRSGRCSLQGDRIASPPQIATGLSRWLDHGPTGHRGRPFRETPTRRCMARSLLLWYLLCCGGRRLMRVFGDETRQTSRPAHAIPRVAAWREHQAQKQRTMTRKGHTDEIPSRGCD